MSASESPSLPMRIAGLQMVSGPRVPDNLRAAENLMGQAVEQGAGALVLPEYFPIIGASDAERLAVREAFGIGPIQDWLRAMAQRFGVWIFAGSIPLTATSDKHLRNASLVYNPKGECVARYDKVHLFAFDNGRERYDEASFIEPGHEAVAVETPFGRVGLSICYDLRFPEYYRSLGKPDLILVPAAFVETTGRAHWEVLLRARAIENQCYVVAVGQGGRHENGRMTHGNSMIIDPWGEVLDRKAKGPGLVIADLDPARIAEVRRQLPALEHSVNLESKRCSPAA